MSEYQRRWLCKECKREWIEPTYHFINSAPCSITGNPKGDNCPVCGSPEISEIAFNPYMPGLDIPRDGDYIVLPKNPILAKIPGRTNDQTVSVKADSIELPPPIISAKEDVTEEEHIEAIVETMERNNTIYDSGVG